MVLKLSLADPSTPSMTLDSWLMLTPQVLSDAGKTWPKDDKKAKVF